MTGFSPRQVGNFKGKEATDQLRPLAGVSVGTALLVGLCFGIPCILFPAPVFGLLTNHTEVIENIDIFVPWLLLVVVFEAIAFMLDGYFLGLTEGHTLRNVSLAPLGVGFAPVAFVASKFESNHILWLAWSLFFVMRTVMLGVQLPRTFNSDVEAGNVSLLALEESPNFVLPIKEESLKQMQPEKVD